MQDTSGFHTDMLVADERNHARQRRTLSHAFSMKALKAQEEWVTEFVNLFITKVREQAEAGQVVDINKWYNYLTFDVIGEMAFGETFGCMETGTHSSNILVLLDALICDARCVQLLGVEHG